MPICITVLWILKCASLSINFQYNFLMQTFFFSEFVTWIWFREIRLTILMYFSYTVSTQIHQRCLPLFYMLISSTFPSICFPSERKGEGWMFGYFLAQCRWLNFLSLKLPQEMIATLQNLSCSVHWTHRNKLISIFNYTAYTAGISYCCVDHQNTSVFCRNDVVGV